MTNKRNEDIELIIHDLKEKGLSQFECFKYLTQELNFSMSEADIIVINSRAWIENKENIENFRNSFFELIDRIDDLEID